MPSDGSPLINLNLTEPISKLIETVGNGIGTLYEPTRIRKKAKADAEALKILTEGKIQAQDLETRSQRRLQHLELCRQKNIEAIIKKAADEMHHEVNGQPVEEDWTVDFFGQCQDVGNETLQSLWARLLAGEVTKPGSFSRRTLHTVKMMDQRDADLFSKLAGFVWETSDQAAHLQGASHIHELLEKVGFYLSDFSYLRSIGLLLQEGGGLTIRVGDQIWSYCGTRIRISATVPGSWHGIHLSQVGAELLPISGAVGCAEYFDFFFENMNNGLNCMAEILA